MNKRKKKVFGLRNWVAKNNKNKGGRHKSESEEFSRLARKRHGANDYKSNITDW